MFSGFFAIVAGMNGGFVAAGLAIYVAMILDAADGRVARMTSSESAFGAEYDSLSDMVAFGVAPALVAFSWALSSLGQIGWVVTFVYMACAALRLARFNTEGGRPRDLHRLAESGCRGGTGQYRLAPGARRPPAPRASSPPSVWRW